MMVHGATPPGDTMNAGDAGAMTATDGGALGAADAAVPHLVPKPGATKDAGAKH
jgi:hypothetical protein